MALPNEKTTPYPKRQEDIDDFALEVLQRLSSQQDEHQRVIGQLESLGLFWDKQQKWNQYANKNKDLKEKVRQLQLKHGKQNEERRIQKLMMQHQYEIREEQSRREQSMEMKKVQQQMTEHRQEWKGVIDDLNSHQAAMHAHLSGRIVTKEGKQQQWDQNKQVLKALMHKLQQRMQQKQVATGGSAGERATGGASMSRSADNIGGGEGGEAKKVAGKKRHREEAACSKAPSGEAPSGAVNDED